MLRAEGEDGSDDDHDRRLAVTGLDGGFAFRVVPGRYRLGTHDGGWRTLAEVVVTEGGDERVDVRID